MAFHSAHIARPGLFGWLFGRSGRRAYPLYILGALVIGAMFLSWWLTINWQIEAGLFPASFETANGTLSHSVRQYFTGPAVAWWGALGALIVAAALWISARRADVPTPLAPVVCFLSVFGVMVLLRLAPTLGWVRDSPSLMALVSKHLIWTVLGMGVMLVTSGAFGRWGVVFGRRHYVALTMMACAATLLTIAFGKERNEHRLWLEIGPFSLQTVEFVKIAFVIAVSAALTAWEPRVGKLASIDASPRFWQGLWTRGMALFLAALIVVPVLLQRDFGPVIQLTLTLAAMLLIGGGSWLLPALLLGATAGAGALCYRLGWPTVVKARIDMWLDPFSNSEQITLALWSIADGGVAGVGLGRGGAHYIPVVHSDFIPALLAEEFGFLGIGAILLLYGVVARCGFSIARRSSSVFAASTAAGLTTLIVSQVALLCAGVAGLAPLTGVTLPFISAGGSSILASFLIIGLLLCLAAQTIPGDEYRAARRAPKPARPPRVLPEPEAPRRPRPASRPPRAPRPERRYPISR